MKTPIYLIEGILALAGIASAATAIPASHFDAAIADANPSPWAFYNVSFFQARPGFGASYLTFFVTNSNQISPGAGDYNASCSSVAFPSDPVNGGTTPQTYTTGPLQGGCDNPNATFTWDGTNLASTYFYASGQVDQNGNEYICRITGYAPTNSTTLTTKTPECGVVHAANMITVDSAEGVC